ncbi:hypothetical protein OTB20_08350 [Streptomyces sp. H27-H1]|uniref:hypothetical protein n=1 Tax=Streptomyces sp. H27-H1 TaxID=2996461 RepID=UPI00226E6FD0|nr:hypothetical protein [Streptomyces sp. H27-H1]MCY0926215.1 hypothetical protein [Streptomyces sp. H27-H1]
MTYRSKYHGRYSGIGAMLSKPWMHAPCRTAGLKLMAEAQAVSPVGDPTEDRHPGLYKASFVVEPLNKNVPFRGKPRIRAGARVMNVAPHAWRVEHGDGRVPRYAPLQKAIDALKAAHGG